MRRIDGLIDSKAKCGFLITLQAEDQEIIIFSQFAEVLDQPPPKFYLYENYGQNAHAKLIYENNSIRIRQWFFISTIAQVNAFKDALIAHSEATIEQIKVKFTIPKCSEMNRESVPNLDTSQFVDDYPLPSTNQKHYKYDRNPKLDKIHFDEIKAEITENLRKEDGSSPYGLDLFPPRFISLSELQNFLTNQICLVDEEIAFAFDFHGERGAQPPDSQYSPSRFIGVLLSGPIDRSQLQVAITAEKINAVDPSITFADPDPDTGIFTIQTTQPLRAGYAYILNRETQDVIAAQRFRLIGKIDIQMHTMSGTQINVFGERIHVSDKKEIVLPYQIMQGRSFSRRALPALSDEGYLLYLTKGICGYLRSLGPEIVIVDRYLLGEIKSDGGQIELNNGSKVFLNALLMLSAQNQINSVGFLCRHDSTDIKVGEMMPSHYAQIKAILQSTGNLKLSIRFSGEYIHDRYWLSFDENSGLYTIGTSISNLANFHEVRIQPIMERAEQAKTRARFARIWHESEPTERAL